jgi:hypothetical protein
MSGLGEQIAVLDGLSALDPNDGRIGQARARVNQYAKFVMRNVLSKRNVISAANGANYSGGSSYAPGLPLLPSSIGLADLPGVLPARRNVIDPSFGVNYMGGASHAPGMPLLPSNAGLASALIEGGYGRAGLGASLINGGYGRAGLGATGTSTDEDLAGAAEAVAYARQMDPEDGRLGQRRAMVDEYGRPVMPGVLARSNVIDPSEGGNYGGGSNYFPGGPLTPSNAGLAGCASCSFDGLSGPNSPISQAREKIRLLSIRRMKYLQIAKTPKFAPVVRVLAKQRVSEIEAHMCRLAPAARVKMKFNCANAMKQAAVRQMIKGIRAPSQLQRAAGAAVYRAAGQNRPAWR